MSTNSDIVYTSVKNYYGKVLESSKDLKTSACTTGSAPHPIVLDAIRKIPTAVLDKFYGCGNPIPLGITGKSILDLGSGSGRDCYAAAALVGPEGSVIGVDMTDEQLTTARENIDKFGETLGYAPNLKFLTGYIEMLREAGVPENSIDICISNCVINLSPDKPRVLQSVYDSLRDGGELYFSDMYADAKIPEAMRTHDVLLGEGMAGALYTKDFESIARSIGFAQPRVLAISHIEVHDAELKALVKDIKFYSVTYRLFKAAQPDEKEIARGQTAVYLGTIAGHEDKYELDVDNVFAKNVPMPISANTAEILATSWLSPFFAVEGVTTEDGKELKTASTESLMENALSASCCKPKQESSECPGQSGCC
ncbi:hypothetical protein FBU59_000813 [Linderina macrospora]|uniref:Uncharacterized protein n=1 Tax=Linderina macrospora TaxID=4868 RepID=A0ACC1JG12_9FUNG|nr:hypothetical protein FBU59_000813 [Linderina macrospora]